MRLDRYGYFEETNPKLKRKLAKGMTPIEEPKPRTCYYHYSNDASQGALICETSGFPGGFFRETEGYHSAYSDRIAGWDYDRFKAACEIAGGGDGMWASRLPILNDDRLKEFAKVALNLDVTPKHVRVIHYFNVSSGYSCPVVIAITDKGENK